MKDSKRFALAAVIMAPILAAEDVLRKVGVNVSGKGIFHNDEGKSISQIWNESEVPWDGKV